MEWCRPDTKATPAVPPLGHREETAEASLAHPDSVHVLHLHAQASGSWAGFSFDVATEVSSWLRIASVVFRGQVIFMAAMDYPHPLRQLLAEPQTGAMLFGRPVQAAEKVLITVAVSPDIPDELLPATIRVRLGLAMGTLPEEPRPGPRW